MEEFKVKNVSEYLDKVNETRNLWDEDELWYRGVENVSYSLMPGLYRGKHTIDGEEEQDLYSQFVRKAKAFVSDYNKLQTLDWYVLMQHYSFPTRLLDWTSGSLIGLFFAVKNIKINSQRCVYIIDPFEINGKFHKREEIFTSDKYMMRDDSKILKSYLPQTKIPDLPLAIGPSYIDKRVIAQKSCFTIHGNIRKPLETLFQEYHVPIIKIIIENTDSLKIKEELHSAGIGESLLFPDLEGLSREMIYEYVIE